MISTPAPLLQPRVALRSYAAAGAAHQHDHAQAVLPLHGTMALQLLAPPSAGGEALAARQQGTVQAGSGVLIAAGQAHTFGALGANRFAVLDFHCRVDGGSFFACDAALEHLLRYLHELDGRGGAAPALLAHAAALLGAAVQGRAAVAPHRATANPPASPSPAIRRALALMQQRLAEPLRVADLAAAAGWSASHLQAEFRRQLGESPARHLARLRLAAAEALLRDTDRPFAQVALACGFSEQSALNRALRRMSGTTPSALRRAGRSQG